MTKDHSYLLFLQFYLLLKLSPLSPFHYLIINSSPPQHLLLAFDSYSFLFFPYTLKFLFLLLNSLFCTSTIQLQLSLKLLNLLLFNISKCILNKFRILPCTQVISLRSRSAFVYLLRSFCECQQFICDEFLERHSYFI